jgi:hypothetical protein
MQLQKLLKCGGEELEKDGSYVAGFKNEGNHKAKHGGDL